MDLDIQRAIEAGQRNFEALELIENWCRHARVEKFGGVGLIEQQTGLPIGHHGMVCDHAPAGGISSYLLEDSAIDFHDRNCNNCTKREPVRLPNISKLISRRDAERERARAQQEALDRQRESALQARRTERASLAAGASVLLKSFLDDIDAFDATRDPTVTIRLVETARLAPELLTPEVVEYLFGLLERGERCFHELGLRVLRAADVDLVRLARCAMTFVASGVELDLAAEIAVERVDHIRADDVAASMVGLAFVAAAPRSPLFDGPEDGGNSVPLRAIFARFPQEGTRGIDALICDRHALKVRLGARAVVILAPSHATILRAVRRSLLSRLAGAELLIDLERDSELRDVVHDLTVAAASALASDPSGTDADVMRYFEGASRDGEARLSGIFEQVMRGTRRRNHEDERTEPRADDVYRTALRRLIQLAGSSENEAVLQDVIGTLRGDPDALGWLAKEQLDNLLGVALVIDSKLLAQPAASAFITPHDPLRAMEAQNRRMRLYYLREGFIRWAVHGATQDAGARNAFLTFLENGRNVSDPFRGAVIEELPPLMQDPSTAGDLLPFLYSAMVGQSSLVRAAAAKCIADLGSRRLGEMPSLVAEAFLLMLSDPFVIVHKAAVSALRQIHLPDEFRSRVKVALGHLVVVYRDEQDNEFLLDCMGAYLQACGNDEDSASKARRIFMAMLRQMPGDLLLRNNHRFLLREFASEDGYAELALSLLVGATADYDVEHALEHVRDIPSSTSGSHREAAMRSLAAHADDASVVGTLLEVFTRDHAWSAAVDAASAHLAAFPNNVRMRARALHAEQRLCHAQFELLISTGNVDEAMAVGARWDAAAAELEDIRKNHEKSDPLRFILRAS